MKDVSQSALYQAILLLPMCMDDDLWGHLHVTIVVALQVGTLMLNIEYIFF